MRAFALTMTQSARRNYTTINHNARIALNITITEYCVFDLIHHLATHPKNSHRGWCYAKKETIAGYFALGRATVFRAIKKGLAAGLLEKHPEQPAFLKATRIWYEAVHISSAAYQNETSRTTMIPVASHNETPASITMRHYKDTDKDSDKNTVEATNAQHKNFSSIGALLDQYHLPQGDQTSTTDWQVEAKRLWKVLRLAGEPSQQFFKHVKGAYKKKQQQRLLIALSYCQDAEGVIDREKLFYWRYANNPQSRKGT